MLQVRTNRRIGRGVPSRGKKGTSPVLSVGDGKEIYSGLISIETHGHPSDMLVFEKVVRKLVGVPNDYYIIGFKFNMFDYGMPPFGKNRMTTLKVVAVSKEIPFGELIKKAKEEHGGRVYDAEVFEKEIKAQALLKLIRCMDVGVTLRSLVDEDLEVRIANDR